MVAEHFKSNYNNQQVSQLLSRNNNNVDNISDLILTTQQVCNSIKCLRNNISLGPDKIPSKIITLCAEEVAPSLTNLFNLSLTSGEVPNEWKLANVIPVFKSGAKNLCSNYRPISITSIVSTVLEKIICEKVLQHLYASRQIPDNQHGFLPRRSCSTMHLDTINKWQCTLDRNSGGHIHAISLDCEKAFDHIPHQRLLLKLRRAGINGSLHDWFASYLSNRKQRVLFDGEYSDEFDVPSGVVQGSVLGPLFFNIFISDLAHCVSSDLIMYADDSTLYRHIKSFQDEVLLQEDLNNIVLWSVNNGMKLNASKCTFIDVTWYL
jgi:hypothetical protein